jgi:tRNA(fMet)-specific endonuclease VapC
MKKFLLDTGIAGDSIDHRLGVFERAREEVARGNRVGIGRPVLGELWFGSEGSSTRDRKEQQLRRVLPSLKVGPFDEDAAEEFGRIAAELKRSGRTIGCIDIQIAAIALSMGKTTVVSSDSDLSAVPGLTVENWAIP